MSITVKSSLNNLARKDRRLDQALQEAREVDSGRLKQRNSLTRLKTASLMFTNPHDPAKVSGRCIPDSC